MLVWLTTEGKFEAMPALRQLRVRKLARRAHTALRYERLARARRAPIDENAVVYESFSGNGMLCNPEAIFRALHAAPDFAHLRHIWVLSDPKAFPETVAEFAEDPRVSFVKHDSPAYYAALATSKYLVNNATFPPQFGKREDQVYLNTWHGTPLKAMGYDIPGGAVDTRNVVRNLVNADYLLAPNEDTAQMYLQAYRMTNVFHGALIEEGTPRIDRQFASPGRKAEIRARLGQDSIDVDDERKIVLYAPTWRGSFYAPNNDVRQLRQTVHSIASQLDSDEYVVLLKVHQQVYKYAVSNKRLREILVPNDIPANDVLAAADVLITDYSSIFVDFLATGRPVLFYTPDFDEFTATRGLYLPAGQWPGPVCRTMDELAFHLKWLHSGGTDDPSVAFADTYEAARERYSTRERGDSTERVIDIVFRGKTDGYRLRRDFSDGRTTMLIHLGGMLSNGITSSALFLLSNIDHDRFDVSVTYPYNGAPSRLELISHIHPRVRQFPRVGGMNGSKLRVRPLVAVKGRSGRQHEKAMLRSPDLLRDEWFRCFGASQFDHVVDFSGYAPFWVKLFTARDTGSLSIWMHNDMRAEASNPRRGEWLRASLEGISGLYRHADHLVSVSTALADVNREKLADKAPRENFTYARNTLNAQRVLKLAHGLTSAEVRSLDPSVLPPRDDSALPHGAEGTMDSVPADLRGSLDTLVSRHGLVDLQHEVDRRAIIATVLPTVPGVRTFVTAGRLSAEKNHERLIRAFDIVHQAHADTRLAILGTGPLREQLVELVDTLGLTGAVIMAGHLANPYGVLARSDCFVLSSDYEGQPMVLLEALVLGLPVVTTAFGSVRGALPEGYGHVVGCSVDELAKGMRAFLRGEVTARPFDHRAYNRDATDEFYRAIGADTD